MVCSKGSQQKEEHLKSETKEKRIQKWKEYLKNLIGNSSKVTEIPPKVWKTWTFYDILIRLYNAVYK